MRGVLIVLTALLIGSFPFSSAIADADNISKRLVIPAADTVQMLTLDDGSTLVGTITEVGNDEIKFQTDLGDMTISVAKIKDIKAVPATSLQDGQYWFPNPNRTRLLIGPTARTLKAGEGYFADLWLFFPGVFYGVTDNITLGAGVSIFPGVDDQLYYFAPKVGFTAAEDLDLALSVFVFRLWDQTAYFGIGSMTYGHEDRSVTAGLGLAWHKNGIADKPAATLGGEYRVSRRVSLVGESWFLPGEIDEGELVMGAVRFFGEKMSVDLGLAYAVDNKGDRDLQDDIDYDFEGYGDDYDTSYDATTWVPYVDFVYNF